MAFPGPNVTPCLKGFPHERVTAFTVGFALYYEPDDDEDPGEEPDLGAFSQHIRRSEAPSAFHEPLGWRNLEGRTNISIYYEVRT
jgi:hypothetical protein